jgi:AraC-like DNA-binding protein
LPNTNLQRLAAIGQVMINMGSNGVTSGRLKRFATVGEGHIRIAPLLALPAVMTDLGVDFWPLAAEAGLNRQLFDDPENIVPFTDLGQLLDLCAQRSGCPHIGLLLGERSGLHVLGMLGDLLMNSADVGSALRSLILYLHLHDRASVPALCIEGQQSRFVYSIYQPKVPGVAHIYDAALLITCHTIERLAGPNWRPVEVHLSRPQPDDSRPYRQFFRAPVKFDIEQSAVVFESRWLEQPIDHADTTMHAILMREMEMLESRGPGDVVEQLRRVLRLLLITNAGREEISQAKIAKLFGLHPRSLNRRLSERGTSFRELLNAARYDFACQLLRDTSLEVTEVAAALDYADATAFAHAFRRWSGTSPAAWRESDAFTFHPVTRMPGNG